MKRTGSLLHWQRLPLVPNQCQISPVHGFPDDLSSLIMLSCLHVGFPRGSLPSGIKTVYVLLLSSIRTTCPAHLILLLSSIHTTCPAHLILDLVTPIIFGDQSTSSIRRCEIPCCVLLNSPSYSEIASSAPYSRAPQNLCSSVSVRNRISHPYKSRNKNIFSIF